MNLSAPISFTVTVQVEMQFLSDVLTTAVEGGMNYWVSSVERIERADDLSVIKLIAPIERGDEPPLTQDIDLTTVQRGIELILAGKVTAPQVLKDLALALAENDPGHIDASDADVIVQAGIFGEVVYG